MEWIIGSLFVVILLGLVVSKVTDGLFGAYLLVVLWMTYWLLWRAPREWRQTDPQEQKKNHPRG